MDKISNNGIRKEAGEYLETLLKFLNLNRDRSKVGIVALETVHHYAAATSLLVEKGLIDQVIFTVYDNGCPLKKDELRKYEKDEIFFGGGYNKRCLSTSIREMKARSSSRRIWAIKELVINSPRDYSNTLRTKKVDELSLSRMIKLEDVVKKLT
jgi:hypothetical protein